jgi:ubiquinone biosynthesis protein Coq4
MRPLRLLTVLTAIGTLGYMAVRWMRRRGVTRIPVEEIK